MVYHQQVDIVAFLSHDLDQRSDTIDGKAIETPEVGHHRIVIDRRIGYQQREGHNQCQAHDGTRAHHLVADVRLQLQLQILADDAKTVEELEV